MFARPTTATSRATLYLHRLDNLMRLLQRSQSPAHMAINGSPPKQRPKRPATVSEPAASASQQVQTTPQTSPDLAVATAVAGSQSAVNSNGVAATTLATTPSPLTPTASQLVQSLPQSASTAANSTAVVRPPPAPAETSNGSPARSKRPKPNPQQQSSARPTSAAASTGVAVQAITSSNGTTCAPSAVTTPLARMTSSRSPMSTQRIKSSAQHIPTTPTSHLIHPPTFTPLERASPLSDGATPVQLAEQQPAEPPTPSASVAVTMASIRSLTAVSNSTDGPSLPTTTITPPTTTVNAAVNVNQAAAIRQRSASIALIDRLQVIAAPDIESTFEEDTWSDYYEDDYEDQLTLLIGPTNRSSAWCVRDRGQQYIWHVGYVDVATEFVDVTGWNAMPAADQLAIVQMLLAKQRAQVHELEHFVSIRTLQSSKWALLVARDDVLDRAQGYLQDSRGTLQSLTAYIQYLETRLQETNGDAVN